MIVKVCGLREAANIRDVETVGADWLGFVCYPKSLRYVAGVPDYLPRKARRVGVFVDATLVEIMTRVDSSDSTPYNSTAANRPPSVGSCTPWDCG